MLPDYPDLKAKAGARLMQFVRSQVPRIAPFLREVTSYAQHEGKRGHLTRADQSTDTIHFPGTQISVEMSRDDMRSLDAAGLRRHLLSLAEQAAEHQAKLLLTRVGEAAASVGNEIDAGGELKPEHLLEMLRKVQTDFDPVTGHRKPGQMWVMHPDMAKKVLPKVQEWEKDPDIITELVRIEDEQREQWRAREARRILAD